MVWGVPLFHLIFIVSKSEGCCPFVAADAVHALETMFRIAVLGDGDERRGVEGRVHQWRRQLDLAGILTHLDSRQGEMEASGTQ